MKLKILPFIFASLVLVFAATGSAMAEEEKMVGVLTKIELAGDGTQAIASIKDNHTGEVVDVVVADEMTIDKFKDNRIVTGDEIRCKYAVENGKKVSKILRKTAGC